MRYESAEMNLRQRNDLNAIKYIYFPLITLIAIIMTTLRPPLHPTCHKLQTILVYISSSDQPGGDHGHGSALRTHGREAHYLGSDNLQNSKKNHMFFLSEMHRTQSDFDDNLTFKVFIFQFINFYSSIIYIAFFKGKFVGYPGHYHNIIGNLRNEDVSLSSIAMCNLYCRKKI